MSVRGECQRHMSAPPNWNASMKSDCGVLVLFRSDKGELEQPTSADIAARNQQSNWKHFIAGSNHESFRSIKSFGPGGCDEGGGDAS